MYKKSNMVVTRPNKNLSSNNFAVFLTADFKTQFDVRSPEKSSS